MGGVLELYPINGKKSLFEMEVGWKLPDVCDVSTSPEVAQWPTFCTQVKAWIAVSKSKYTDSKSMLWTCLGTMCSQVCFLHQQHNNPIVISDSYIFIKTKQWSLRGTSTITKQSPSKVWTSFILKYTAAAMTNNCNKQLWYALRSVYQIFVSITFFPL